MVFVFVLLPAKLPHSFLDIKIYNLDIELDSFVNSVSCIFCVTLEILFYSRERTKMFVYQD